MYEISRNKIFVSAAEVGHFNARWPCSELDSNRAYWFEFDGQGDLVDTDVPEHSDGGAAVAMASDCQTFLEDGTAPEWSIQ